MFSSQIDSILYSILDILCSSEEVFTIFIMILHLDAFSATHILMVIICI